MKSTRKTKPIILIILGILLPFLPIFVNISWLTDRDLDITSNNDEEFNHDNLKTSAVSGKIHIINNSGWAAFKAAGNCTGSGTYSDPYIIENLIIDGEGSGSCILIEDSNVYFKIENCTVYNSEIYNSGGIFLRRVDNGYLINNSCSYNYIGIYLAYCNNHTISGNIVYLNDIGIWVDSSNNNNIARNIAINNDIGLYCSHNKGNIVSENTASYNEDKGINLQVCNSYVVSGNNASYNGDSGIYLSSSNNNNIFENTASNNSRGITLRYSNSNTIYFNNFVNNYNLNLFSFESSNTWYYPEKIIYNFFNPVF